jgi:hypothetical protein
VRGTGLLSSVLLNSISPALSAIIRKWRALKEPSNRWRPRQSPPRPSAALVRFCVSCRIAALVHEFRVQGDLESSEAPEIAAWMQGEALRLAIQV